MNNTSHFENVWEESEQISNKVESSNENELIDSIISLLNEFKTIENKSTKFRKFGDLLFKISKLSLLENVNVYDALVLSIKYNKISISE